MLASRLLLRVRPVASGSVVFAAALGVALASALGMVRVNGLILLLIVEWIVRRRLLTPSSILLIASIAIVSVLRSSSHWYTAHTIAPLLSGLAVIGTAILSTPASITDRLSGLSHRSFAIWCVALPVSIFQCFSNGDLHSGDTKPIVPTAVQMLRYGNRDLAAWTTDGRWDTFISGEQLYFLRRCEGRPGLYSAYPAGMEIFALPAAAGLVIAGLEATPGHVDTAERNSARLLNAATLSCFYLLAAHFVRRPAAWIATALLALGSTFTSTTAKELWQQGGVAFWIVIVLLCEVKNWSRWLQGFACAAMIACRPSAITFLMPFAIWLIMKDWRCAITLMLRSIICYLPVAVMYWSHYGTPFGPSMRMLHDHWRPAEHLGGVVASPARGVLVYQPWLLLLCIRQHWSPWKWMLAGVVVLHTMLISSWPMWWGGHCYGSRLMTEMVLVSALLILQPLDVLLLKNWGRWLVAAFVLLGLAIHLPGGFGCAMEWNAIPVAVDAHPERLWDWRDPPMLYQFNH